MTDAGSRTETRRWKAVARCGTERRETADAIRRFASLVAHEIRNPLAAIGAGAQYLMRAGTRGPEQRETCDLLLAEVKRLDAIVGDLARAGRAGEPLLAAEDLNAVVRAATASAVPGLAAGGVALVLDPHPTLPLVAIDAAQVRAVLEELIANAVAASPRGSSVTVRTGLAFDAAVSPPAAFVRVEDEGAGIDEAIGGKIFEPFFSTRPGARGLGLAFCRAVAAAHSGVLRVESAPGEGAAFTLLVPSATTLVGEDGCPGRS